VHRDIKPENILFEAGHAVVADFGIARAVSEAGGAQLTETGLAVGSPTYMSPEQAAATGPPDARSDLYSLACVLYEMLAGTPPYTGPTVQAVLARKAAEPAPGLRVVRDTVPPAVEAVIMRALSRVPADRYATAHDFATALAGKDAPAPVASPARLPPGRLVALASVIVVLAAVAYVVLAVAGQGTTPSTLVFTHLTVEPGIEWFPSLSPDGEWIAYAGDASGNRDIYLRRVDGENAFDLTADSPDDDDEPAFSPDGERIAFRSERDGGGLFVMGRSGEAPRRVTRAGFAPSWSPDGAWLVFANEDLTLKPEDVGPAAGLQAVNVETGALRVLTTGDATLPSWSPGGRRIAYTRRDQTRGDIWTVPAAGGEPAPVTSDAATTDWNPAWSPDGHLYFVSDRGGSMNLWRIAVDEQSGEPRGEPEPVTTPATFLAHPAFSADGRRVAYSSIHITQNIQRAAVDPRTGAIGPDLAWVTTGSRRWSNPDPSPDGARVVFFSTRDPEGGLYVTRSDGTGLRRLSGDSARDMVPTWSPDGEWIAFLSNRGGRSDAWTIRPDGSGLRLLTDGTQGPVTWSPDASRLAVLRRRPRPGGPAWELARPFVMHADRSSAEQSPEVLPPRDTTLRPFRPGAWSPDGAWLAGDIAVKDSGVVVYSLRSRTYQRLTDFGQWPVWLPDSRRVLFVSGGDAFYVVDRVTKNVRKVFSVTRDVLGPPRLSRDGRTVYYSRRVTESDIWLAELQ